MASATPEVNVTIKDFAGKSHPIRVSLSITGKELKAIVAQLCLPDQIVRLHHSGRQVTNKKTLADINLRDGDELKLLRICRLPSCKYPRFSASWLGAAPTRRILFELAYMQRLIRDPNPLITDFRPVIPTRGDFDRYVVAAMWKALHEGSSPAEGNPVYSEWQTEEVQFWWLTMAFSPPDLPPTKLLFLVSYPEAFPLRPPALCLVSRFSHPLISSHSQSDGAFRWLPSLSDEWGPATFPTMWCPPIAKVLNNVWDEDWRDEAMCDYMGDDMTAPRRQYEATYRVYRVHAWTPALHFVCSAAMKQAARMALLLHKRPECCMHTLPKDIVLVIIKLAIMDLAIEEDVQRRSAVEERVRQCVAARLPKEPPK